MTRLTDEQRATHIGNSDCGAITLTTSIMQDCEAVQDHVARYVFDAGSLLAVMEALQLAQGLMRSARDTLDLHVTAYAMASLDALHGAADMSHEEFDE